MQVPNHLLYLLPTLEFFKLSPCNVFRQRENATHTASSVVSQHDTIDGADAPHAKDWAEEPTQKWKPVEPSISIHFWYHRVLQKNHRLGTRFRIEIPHAWWNTVGSQSKTVWAEKCGRRNGCFLKARRFKAQISESPFHTTKVCHFRCHFCHLDISLLNYETSKISCSLSWVTFKCSPQQISNLHMFLIVFG